MLTLNEQHPYVDFLHGVEKPARYVGGEYNSIVKPEAAARMCLAFPDVYDIGMSHLGTRILYSIINKEPDLALERAYTPWPDMEEELRNRKLPVLSLETSRSLMDFDVVGFSLQYEMTFTNVLTMLDLCGIPLRGEQRTLDHPLIIGGGPTATHPEPVAPFFDAFLIGDAEAVLPDILREIAKLRDAKASRQDRLIALSKMPGVYVPALYETTIDERSGLLVVDRPTVPGVPAVVTRTYIDDLNAYPFPSDSPEPVAEAIFDRVSIEIARGCTEGCRFCQAGMIYRPVRERDPDQIVDSIVAAVEKGGYDEASLTSLSTADYSCVSPLIKRVMSKLRPRKVSLSVSSLRAYGLDEDLLDEMSSVRATGLTFAPEAGTQRMRDVVNKNIDEEDILTTCHRVFKRGWKRVKLYFMIGLPTEQEEDVVGIAELGRQALQVGRSYERNVDVTVSVSSHVPKPHTPFQWCAMDSIDDIMAKQEILFRLARKYGFKFRKHDMRVSHLEGIVTRGDRRAADLIELAWRKGARFDGWDEHLNWECWQEALNEWEEKWGVNRYDFLATLPVDGRLPWDHIDVGLEDGFLRREYQRSVAGRLSPPCGKPVGAKVHHTNLQDADEDERKLVCYNCGVACDMTLMRQERKDYLGALGALKPTERSTDSTERDQAYERYRKGLTPREFDPGENAPYRLHYTKLGQVALQGHLDVVRMLPRIFRRAGLSLVYSVGFHPKPQLAYGPALALGVQSISEYADIRLTEPVPDDELLARLQLVSPEGLRFIAARRLQEGEKKLSKVLDVQDYLLTLPEQWFEGKEDSGTPTEILQAICDEFLAEDEILIKRLHKRKLKKVDARAGVKTLVVLDRSEWPEGLVLRNDIGVRARMLLNHTAAVAKPSELARLLFDIEMSHADMARMGLWGLDSKGEVIDLLAPPPAPVVNPAPVAQQSSAVSPA